MDFTSIYGLPSPMMAINKYSTSFSSPFNLSFMKIVKTIGFIFFAIHPVHAYSCQSLVKLSDSCSQLSLKYQENLEKPNFCNYTLSCKRENPKCKDGRITHLVVDKQYFPFLNEIGFANCNGHVIGYIPSGEAYECSNEDRQSPVKWEPGARDWGSTWPTKYCVEERLGDFHVNLTEDLRSDVQAVLLVESLNEHSLLANAFLKSLDKMPKEGRESSTIVSFEKNVRSLERAHRSLEKLLYDKSSPSDAENEREL